MNHAHSRFIPALGFEFLTPIYDPLGGVRHRHARDLDQAVGARRARYSAGEPHVADWGKPTPLLRAMFYAVQILDGFANTRDHVEGRLGQVSQDAGFRDVAITGRVNTCLGTIALYRAVKRP